MEELGGGKRQGRVWSFFSVFFLERLPESEELVEKLVGRLGNRGDREGELVEKLGGEERRGIAANDSFIFLYQYIVSFLFFLDVFL